MSNDILTSARFPRANRYSAEWLMANVSGAANSLWLAEWVSEALELRPGMRVLDLGCGRAASSIFLHREFGVEVWGCDLWFNPTDNLRRIQDAGVTGGVFPLHTDARSLPFAEEFFDAIIALDSFIYFGTDDLYLNYVARFVKPDGAIAIAGAGLTQEIEAVPEHLATWWTPDMWCLHSAEWWRTHWQRTGIVKIERASALEEGWERWLEWIRAVAPENTEEIAALERDHGRTLGYVSVVGRRDPKAVLGPHVVSVPGEYAGNRPLLRERPR